ncbi:MAG TPA: hypothetical protein VM118_00840 [Acidobacteriota bacterium]|nr:hypothetical protein [Acidobacteriota bacterium]
MSLKKTGLLIIAVIACTAGTLWAQPRTIDKVEPVGVYLTSAKIALQTNPPEYQRAMRNLATAREHYPENYEVHFLLATIWAEKDEIDSMVVEYAVAEHYATEKQWNKAAKDLRQIYDNKWLNRFNRAVSLFGQADSLSEVGDTITVEAKADSLRGVIGQIRGMAREALRQCMIVKPEDFRAVSLRGLIHQREGQIAESLGDFVKAESLFHRFEFKDTTTNWYDTTTFFMGAAGQPTEQFKEYERQYKKLSEEKRTRYRNLQMSLAAAFYDSEDWEECVVVNRRFQGLFPNDISAIVTLADCFSRLENEQEAFRWQELVVRRNPESKDTWYNLGSFFYNAALRLQDSIVKYARMVETDRQSEAGNAGYLENWSASIENFILAVPRFDKVIELDPKDDETVKLRAIAVFTVASMLEDIKIEIDEARRQKAVDATWVLITPTLGMTVDQMPALWTMALDALIEANRWDEEVLCRMIKVALARLGDVEGLRKWTPKCP